MTVASDLVKTPNGTYVTKEVAEAAGLDVLKRKAPATRKAPAKRKAAAGVTRKSAVKRKAATTRKGKA